MKVRISHLAVGLLAVLALGPLSTARAQTIITIGSGLAHDCFLHAKAGNQLIEGVSICDRALEHDVLSKKDRAGTYDNRGVMLDMLGRTERAAEDFNMAITLDPALGDPYVNLGAMLIKKGQHEAALEQINKGMDLGMGFPHIGYYDRAVAEQMLGRYKEAYYDYKKVLELEPNFAMASERLKDFVVTRVPANARS
ncbi:MAG TPA: tetratricopeptide repeat protein [Rhizomicrobium sp.]|nr:tetratricopeptide repeat protein [Rhizomicrobium sp.]